VILTEDVLKEVPGVKKVTAHLGKKTVEVEGDFGENPNPEIIVEELNKCLAKHNYTLSTNNVKDRINWKDFNYAVPIAILFVLFFILLQKVGIVNLITTSEVSYSSTLLIGLIASLSSCLAVVGGLVLSVSANFAKSGQKTKPQILFHVGRLLGFFVLGGLIGVLGSVFHLNASGNFILAIIIGIIMLILGINLLDIFHITKTFQITLPKFISKNLLTKLKETNYIVTPFLLGIATFFLPCGFTQSMQIYSLSTGNFIEGALTMFIFALGTLPVLALLSFSSFTITNKSYAGVFYKTAGIIVITLAIVNILSAFTLIGLLPPLFNF
jgi:sulfite exporter TauE/SafE/copper chaperone CopZ